MTTISVETLLPPTHRLIIEFSTLFLKLVVTHIKRIPSQAMVTHPHLILLTIQVVEHLVVSVLVIVIDTGLGNVILV